jgi:DNA-binding NarL/FixJ family response regulator
VVDDHPIVRAGLRAVLDAAADLAVIAEGVNGADALHLVALHSPSVLVLDVNLPDLNGLEVTRQLRAQHTSTAILALTVHSDSETIFSLLESGAIGYVLKDEALETLAHAVRAAAQGDSWLSPAVARHVVQRAVEHSTLDTTSATLAATHACRAASPFIVGARLGQRRHRRAAGDHQAHRAESHQQHLRQTRRQHAHGSDVVRAAAWAGTS